MSLARVRDSCDNTLYGQSERQTPGEMKCSGIRHSRFGFERDNLVLGFGSVKVTVRHTVGLLAEKFFYTKIYHHDDGSKNAKSSI